jgi:hypothetical protein
MAIATGTYLTYSAKGIREDLSDVIYQISPEETPFLNNVGKGSASSTYFEWQTDVLGSAGANAVVEGNEAAFSAPAATKRRGNYCQISTKTALVSGTLDAVSKAGRKAELAYQLSQRAAELKLDVEYALVRNQAAVGGNSTTARQTAGFESFLITNVDRGPGSGTAGADPTLSGTTEGYPNAAPTDANATRAFSETILKSVMKSIYESGGNAKILMVGPGQKQVVSTFTGLSANRNNVNSGASAVTIVGAADAYLSDFGLLTVVPNRVQRNQTALFFNPEGIQVKYLRPFQTVDIARTGDADKKLMLVEFGLFVGNEAAHGAAADLS